MGFRYAEEDYRRATNKLFGKSVILCYDLGYLSRDPGNEVLNFLMVKPLRKGGEAGKITEKNRSKLAFLN